MKIHTILRLVLCITGISTGITQAMDGPKATPSLFNGLGSWLRTAFTPSTQFKQHCAVLGGVGLFGVGYLGTCCYNTWCKKNNLRQLDEAKRNTKIKPCINATNAILRHDHSERLAPYIEDKTTSEHDIMAGIASTLYNDHRNDFLRIFASDTILVMKRFKNFDGKEIMVLGNKEGISRVCFTKYQKETTVLPDFLPSYFNAKHDLELRKTQLDEKVAEHATTPEFKTRYKEYKRNR